MIALITGKPGTGKSKLMEKLYAKHGGLRYENMTGEDIEMLKVIMGAARRIPVLITSQSLTPDDFKEYNITFIQL